MTVGIAARYDHGIVCASDTAVGYGNNRFTLESIKGEERGDGFVLYAGTVWACQLAIATDPEGPFIDAVRACGRKFRDTEKHPSFPAEFIEVIDTTITIIDGDGSVFPRMNYAVIGHGSSTAWPLMDALYNGGSLTAVKRQLAKVLRLCDKYDATVHAPFEYRDEAYVYC